MAGTYNIVIGGEAGQGLVTVGNLLSKALVRSGYFICVTQSYQSRIRGGHNTFEMRIGTDEVVAPKESIDLLIALTKETFDLHKDKVAPNATIITDSLHKISCKTCLGIPYKELASPKSANIVALGVAGCLLGLDEELIAKIVYESFGKKSAETAQENRTALTKSYEWTKTNVTHFERLPSVSKKDDRLMMNGNDAIALGALAAGIKFYSFYPMTPSTSIGLNLALWSSKAGLVVEQAEDEIAAINMAIGASFAGAPSMVATSGGGFALMVEGVSLSAMTETPIVIVVGQRPAPATGLPTRTEQADLEFVLHSGHGEFPRAIFVPGSVEECFELTHKAFHLAEKYQSPIFILTDQFLADSYRAITPFDVNKYAPVTVGAQINAIRLPYRRHELTEDGVSPRLLPGFSKNLVITDSDEHAEDGHLTENLEMRKLMVEKRLKKLSGIKRENTAPELIGDKNPNLLFVSWGSTKGAAAEAAAELKSGGKNVSTLHFSQVWPLVAEQFTDMLKNSKEVICIEGNATGQFARLIRRETGFEIKKHIRRYDGLPITPEYILKNLSSPL